MYSLCVPGVRLGQPLSISLSLLGVFPACLCMYKPYTNTQPINPTNPFDTGTSPFWRSARTPRPAPCSCAAPPRTCSTRLSATFRTPSRYGLVSAVGAWYRSIVDDGWGLYVAPSIHPHRPRQINTNTAQSPTTPPTTTTTGGPQHRLRVQAPPRGRRHRDGRRAGAGTVRVALCV